MAHLRANGWLVVKIHGGPMQRPGLPDLLCLRDGEYLWIEVKRPGGKLTRLQEATIKEIEAHGGKVLVATSTKDLTTLDNTLSCG